ncbi:MULTISPECIES: PilZ domain-containing protein [Halomonadaceae]|jgi:type IV pilus assembly protein PilZ|uniref:Type IV fimbriae assembly protein n=2 Tax=Vreelandella TaxID=3137766 RepID=A0A6F8SUU7_9GAMM|nr:MULTISPECIES: PilZ domain-containing protein [Halomonas]KTG25694.1 pilus assembly protein PilZ [Idiomarina sp. H105]MEC7296579.1 PilZ domain-containing protein [Pseudomonadota bacterium]OAE95528.1 pilus assembly protein PilZ [Idiomarina sp. WRN-38]MAG54446.1 pilus assembly protein PilZ [Halomonas sp.]MAM03439.1 pilus assembly protein PilZ [Halomonas sp.]|tara:strand:- start:123 stop:458 length:336 start_codon:yes stop_codon:yes gene_type:complete
MAAQKALSLTIPDVPTLLSAYMPFLDRGGIFVPTKTLYSLGQPVVLLLTLPGESERLSVTGQVIWISPEGVSGRRLPGIGVHFSQQDYSVRDRIETLLAGQLDKAPPSFTL